MCKTIVSLFAATLFTMGTVAPAVACGGTQKTTSEKSKKKDNPKADKSNNTKSKKTPKA